MSVLINSFMYPWMFSLCSNFSIISASVSRLSFRWILRNLSRFASSYFFCARFCASVVISSSLPSQHVPYFIKINLLCLSFRVWIVEHLINFFLFISVLNPCRRATYLMSVCIFHFISASSVFIDDCCEILVSECFYLLGLCQIISSLCSPLDDISVHLYVIYVNTYFEKVKNIFAIKKDPRKWRSFLL